MLRLDGRVDALDEERELVSAEPGRGVGAAQAGADPRRDLDEQRIAGGVAERVVDALEVVDVEEDHRDARASLGAPPQPVLDLLAEERAVGEIGERVVVGLMRQLLLQLGEPRDGALHAAVLEDHSRSCRQRAEEPEVAHVERVRVEVPPHHEAADHSRLAPEQRHHRLVDSAVREHLRARIIGGSAADDHPRGLGFEHVVELAERDRHHDLVRLAVADRGAEGLLRRQ